MIELFSQLGIDWKILIAQSVNFFIVLLALNFLVYKPLISMMNERRKKIEFGLKGAEEAEKRLKEIDVIKKEKISEAEKKAFEIVDLAGAEAKKAVANIHSEAETKAEQILAEAKRTAEHRASQELLELNKKARELVKEAIVRTVELSPDKIDESLIDKALASMQK